MVLEHGIASWHLLFASKGLQTIRGVRSHPAVIKYVVTTAKAMVANQRDVSCYSHKVNMSVSSTSIIEYIISIGRVAPM